MSLQSIFNPPNLILLGAILAAVGALWAARQQSEFERQINNKNEQIIEVTNETLAKVTGGDSVPKIGFNGNGFSVSHFGGEHPIFDLNIQLAEIWWPLPGEGLPEGYWNASNSPVPEMPMTPRKNIDHRDLQILLPGQAPYPEGFFRYDPKDMMFPETNKFLLQFTFHARNGRFLQFVAGKQTIDENGKPTVEISFLLVDGKGKKIEGDDKWVKAEPFVFNNSEYHPGELYIRDW